MRPYGSARAGSIESTVTAAPARSVLGEEPAQQLGGEERRGAVEDEHVAVEAVERALRASATASPVPRGSRLHGDLDALGDVLAARRHDDHDPVGAELARRCRATQSITRLPSSGCRCFGVAERMRVPRPAAMTTTASGRLTRLERWLGRQDSNLGSRDQNPLPYHLATPQ